MDFVEKSLRERELILYSSRFLNLFLTLGSNFAQTGGRKHLNIHAVLNRGRATFYFCL